MSNHVAWLLLSFAIMVVAMLATLYEKVEKLEKRLERFEAREGAADDGISVADPAQVTFTERAGRHPDHRG
ncbi:MAG TPA: hypothetical protein VIG07_10765 [Methylomirabilota bacterium]|jgi:hypothetical protein